MLLLRRARSLLCRIDRWALPKEQRSSHRVCQLVGVSVWRSGDRRTALPRGIDRQRRTDGKKRGHFDDAGATRQGEGHREWDDSGQARRTAAGDTVMPRPVSRRRARGIVRRIGRSACVTAERYGKIAEDALKGLQLGRRRDWRHCRKPRHRQVQQQSNAGEKYPKPPRPLSTARRGQRRSSETKVNLPPPAATIAAAWCRRRAGR